ncbi:MAG TPA: proliferating cell nuclear antigen (pcna) [archaeon]|nr:proliferating cell nuclear antigen (pcna) [archaeon]
MNLVFEDASLFRKCVDGISVLVDEAEFIIDEKGLSLKATDPSQISLVDFELPKKAFKKFDVKKSSRIGLDLNYLGQVMSRAKSGDSVEFLLSDDASKLVLVFSGKSKRSFTIPLLDLTSGDLPLPKIDFDAEIKIKADALNDSFKDASLISTHIVLSVENDSFFVRANSSKGNLENIYTQKDHSVVSLKASNEVRAMFPLDYLANIIKAASSDTEILVSLKTNAPVQINYSLGDGKLQYFLAPRIESD